MSSGERIYICKVGFEHPDHAMSLRWWENEIDFKVHEVKKPMGLEVNQDGFPTS